MRYNLRTSEHIFYCLLRCLVLWWNDNIVIKDCIGYIDSYIWKEMDSL